MAKSQALRLMFVSVLGLSCVCRGDPEPPRFIPIYMMEEKNYTTTAATPVVLHVRISTEHLRPNTTTDTTTTTTATTQTETPERTKTTMAEERPNNDTTSNPEIARKVITIYVDTYWLCVNTTGKPQKCELLCKSENFRCENGGYCVIDKHNFPVCKCPNSADTIYTGPHCEVISDPIHRGVKSNCDCFDETFILVATFTALVIIVLFIANLVTVYCFRKREKKRATSMHKFTFVRNGHRPPFGSNRLPNPSENPYTDPSYLGEDADRKVSTDTTYNSVVYLESSAYINGNPEDDKSLPLPPPRRQAVENDYLVPRLSVDATAYDIPKGDEDSSATTKTNSSTTPSPLSTATSSNMTASPATTTTPASLTEVAIIEENPEEEIYSTVEIPKPF